MQGNKGKRASYPKSTQNQIVQHGSIKMWENLMVDKLLQEMKKEKL